MKTFELGGVSYTAICQLAGSNQVLVKYNEFRDTYFIVEKKDLLRDDYMQFMYAKCSLKGAGLQWAKQVEARVLLAEEAGLFDLLK